MADQHTSTRTLFLYTAAFAGGFSLLRLTGGIVFEFCLGALTVLIAVGLIQQIIWPPQSTHRTSSAGTARRFCLLMILGCLCLAIYRAHYPYHLPSPNDIGEAKVNVIDSSVAMPLWVFTLVLGALTSRGVSQTRGLDPSSSRRHSPVAMIVTIAVILAYLAHVAMQWAFITSLVDLAIQGVKVGMRQGPATDTPHFVAWFGRNPQQFEEFIAWQVWSWPPLLVALFVAVGISQISKTTKCRLALSLGLVTLLAIPATINAIWLADGGARQIFPEYVETYWLEPRPELAMILPLLLLVTLYLTTRRAHLQQHLIDIEPQTLACDRNIVGWLFIGMGASGLVSMFNEFHFVDSTLELVATANFMEIVQSIPQLIGDLISYPEYTYLVYLLPFGIGWLWRRRNSQSHAGERWPQVGVQQMLCFPVVLLLLMASTLLCVPFGIAALHFHL